ncbi:TPA: hypothetical protein LVM22_001153 [Klebsiella oxytoca]|nr:hypothetical protein [Klebsiella oxytoca]
MKITPSRYRQALLFLTRCAGIFALTLAFMLLVAHLGQTYQEEFHALRRLMFNGRWYLLAWRCLLYIIVYAGIVWLWKRSVLRQLPPTAVYRLAAAFTLLVAVNELAVWSAEVPV